MNFYGQTESELEEAARWLREGAPGSCYTCARKGRTHCIDDEDIMEETGLGIHKAICAIKLAIAGGGGVQKTSKAPMGYMFRGIEAFDNILCGMTAEHGVNVYPRILSKEIVHGTTAKGSYQSHVVVEIEWTYVCSLDGSKQVTSTIGEAMDTQDKAFNKAMQASRKYADIMVFRIPTAGDDTEIYVPEPAAQAPAGRPDRPQGVDTPIAAVVAQELPRGDLLPAPEQAKRTRGPNKPKDAPAEQPVHVAQIVDAPADLPFAPNGAGPANQNGVAALVSRVNNTNTFEILYKFAQQADSDYPAGTPDKNFVFGAIKSRAIALFGAAKDMKGVQEGFELVTALGQPDDLKAAANQAYGRFRA